MASIHVGKSGTAKAKERLQYEDLKQLLEESVAAAVDKTGVVLNEDFFETVGYKIVEKKREIPQKRWLLSEESTRYENFSTVDTQYSFKSSYGQTRSFGIQSTKGYSIGIGSNLKAGFMGGEAGVNASLQYNKQMATSVNESQAETKELSLQGTVRPGHYAIVKESRHNAQYSAECDLNLKVQVNAKVPFMYRDIDGTEMVDSSVEISKLFKKGGLNHPCIERVQNNVIIKLRTVCIFNDIEHTLDVKVVRRDGDRPRSNFGSSAEDFFASMDRMHDRMSMRWH